MVMVCISLESFHVIVLQLIVVVFCVFVDVVCIFVAILCLCAVSRSITSHFKQRLYQAQGGRGPRGQRGLVVPFSNPSPLLILT